MVSLIYVISEHFEFGYVRLPSRIKLDKLIAIGEIDHRMLWCLLWIQAGFEGGTPTQIRREGNTWTLVTGIRELSGPSGGTRVRAVRVWP